MEVLTLMRSTIEVQLLAERSGQRQAVAKAALMEQAIVTMHKRTETSTSLVNRWNKNTLLCFE